MIKRLDIGSLRFTFSFTPLIKVVGVNSYVGDDQHILMWDFDHNTLEEVKQALRVVQTRYFLSDIIIAQTGRTRGYHAYCFTAVDWRRGVEIMAATPCVDMKYLKWCLFRGRFTLRVGEKMGRTSRKVATLEGYCLPDATVADLKSWVVYETVGKREWWKYQRGRLKLILIGKFTKQKKQQAILQERWQDKAEQLLQEGKEIVMKEK